MTRASEPSESKDLHWFSPGAPTLVAAVATARGNPETLRLSPSSRNSLLQQASYPSFSLSLRSRATGSLVSHSQMTSTRQPIRRSSALVARSRWTFRFSFAFQYREFDAGMTAFPHRRC